MLLSGFWSVRRRLLRLLLLWGIRRLLGLLLLWGIRRLLGLLLLRGIGRLLRLLLLRGIGRLRLHGLHRLDRLGGDGLLDA